MVSLFGPPSSICLKVHSFADSFPATNRARRGDDAQAVIRLVVDQRLRRYHGIDLMDSALDNLPIIPHEDVADVDCCGCLMIRLREGEADILCNECGAIIRKVAATEVKAALLEMSQTDTICTVHCTHCGALNSFPRFSTIEAFICSERGEGAVVKATAQ
jgi:hypothetical protein